TKAFEHGINLTNNETDFVRVPLLGACPASPKNWVEDTIESWIQIQKDIIRGRRMYLLRVKGESMNRVMSDGDIVIVDADAQPKNGDVVVICVDEEYTMKRFYKH